jgi:hypothetical protein
MIGRRQLALVILVVGAAVLCLQLFRRGADTPSVRAHETAAAPTTTLEQHGTRRINQLSSDSRQSEPEEAIASAPVLTQPRINQPAAAPAEPVPETAESAGLPAPTVLGNMRTTLRQYAAAFGENPVGTNPEITSALAGQNPKQINFLKPDGNRVNPKGELVDTWGTAYFFHQLSAHQMEIRSAGPDRVMYTADDLVTR